MVIISTVHRYDKYFHGESHGLGTVFVIVLMFVERKVF